MAKLCPFYDFTLIAIEKPSQHDILRTALTRILTFGIWLESYGSIFSRYSSEILTEVRSFFDSAISNRKSLSTRYFENPLS